MYLRSSAATTTVFFLLTWATCLVAHEPALGQCGGSAVPAKTEGKPASGCGASAIPTRAEDASAARRPLAGAANDIDLPGYFDSLGPDASLWYQHVQTLANPAFEGRAPGTRGAELAAEYIEFYFRQYSLQPPFSGKTGQGAHTAANAGKSYRQPLTLGGVVAPGYETNGTLAISGVELAPGKDFVITANARRGKVEGGVTFVGYGLEHGENGYTSFDEGVDLRGRVALLLGLEPLNEDGSFRWGSEVGQYSSLVGKLGAVASRGAAGILIVNPPGARLSPEPLDPLPTVAGGFNSLPPIPTAMITSTVADRLLRLGDPQSRDLMTWRRLADEGKVKTVNLSDKAVVSLRSNVESAEVTTENVAATLQGKGSLKDEWIVIGGHYDAPGRPLQNSPCYAGGKLLPGADDNASGTAAVLVLAKRLTEAYAAYGDDANLRSVLFVAFAAEETDLNGSRHFVESTPIPLDKIHAMLNLDMVGRMRQDTLWLSGVGTATEFMGLLDPLLRESGLRVITEPGGTGSDQVSFWNVGVPALFVMTGGHDELHSPADKADTMNPDGAGKVVDLVEKIALRLAVHSGALTFVAQGSATASGCCGRAPAKVGVNTSQPTGCAGGTGTAKPSNDAQSAPQQQADLPDTPVGRCAAAFFEAFNSGSDDQMREFESRHRAASSLAERSMQDRIAQANMIRGDLGTMTPLRVVSTDVTEITILARSSGTSDRWMMTFQFESQSPHGLVSLRIIPVSPEAEASPPKPIDEALRKDAIKQIADALRESYVYPEVGKRMADVLVKHESEGRYSAVTSASDLAQRLTTDLFAVCKDHHLSVRPNTGPAFAAGCGSNGETGEDNRNNYGFRKSELLPGNIGYIKFDMFHGSKRAQEVAAAALAFVTDCDALVFDLRENGGGSPQMIRFISSYLFDKPTHLNSFYDRLNNKTSETWTLDSVPGKRFPNDLPVYVLTSSFTGSAAEEFTYNLKNLERATIVGETTVGAAHLVTERVINEQFLLRVPYARAYNPVTKDNWEGAGVRPDIQVSASAALDAACKDAADKIGARRQAQHRQSQDRKGDDKG